MLLNTLRQHAEGEKPCSRSFRMFPAFALFCFLVKKTVFIINYVISVLTTSVFLVRLSCPAFHQSQSFSAGHVLLELASGTPLSPFLSYLSDYVSLVSSLPEVRV